MAERDLGERERRAWTDTLLASTGVSAPIGRFLLIRAHNEVCALRFTQIRRGGDTSKSSILSSGEETLYAEYQWYRPKAGRSNFSNGDVESGQGLLAEKAPVGIGRFAFGWGNRTIQCGAFRLSWSYPNIVDFRQDARKRQVEFAPTKWREVGEINVRDSRLTWYRYDEDRKETYIRIDEIW